MTQKNAPPKHSAEAKREVFAVEFATDFNGPRAAKAAGFTGTAKSLGVTASKLLADAKIQARVRAEVEQRLTRARANGDALVDALIRTAFRNGAEFRDPETKQGRTFAELPDELLEDVEAIDYDTELRDPVTGRSPVKRFRLTPKQAARDLLARYFGILKPEEVNHSGRVEVAVTRRVVHATADAARAAAGGGRARKAGDSEE